MRIIIESDEQTSVKTYFSNSTPPAQVDALDGGSPPESLIQSIGEAIFAPMERQGKEGMEGGSPPEWLVEAIQNDTNPYMQGPVMKTNGQHTR